MRAVHYFWVGHFWSFSVTVTFHNPSAYLKEHKPAKSLCIGHNPNPYAVYNIHIFHWGYFPALYKIWCLYTVQFWGFWQDGKHDSQSTSMWHNRVPPGSSWLDIHGHISMHLACCTATFMLGIFVSFQLQHSFATLHVTLLRHGSLSCTGLM